MVAWESSKGLKHTEGAWCGQLTAGLFDGPRARGLKAAFHEVFFSQTRKP